ncbi:condensation domain-containing protein, partial [Pseudomonas brassicacearum]
MPEHKQDRTQELVARLRNLDGERRRQLFAKLAQAGVNVARLPIVPALEQGPQPLSYAQQRQHFLWQLEPSSSAYNIPAVLRLNGALDMAALQAGLEDLVRHQGSLRTRFVEHQGQVCQVLDDALHLTLVVDEVGANDEVESAIKAYAERCTAQPFDLMQGPLARVNLLRVASDDHVLVLTLHHSIADGWSINVLIEQWLACYASRLQGQVAHLAEAPIQYADYAAWQRQWLESGEGDRQLAYWKDQLGEAPEVLTLRTDRPRPTQASHRGAVLDLNLDPALLEGLKALAQRQDVSLFMLLLASFQALLHRYSGQAEIHVGVPVANRNRMETERLIGFFVNTQVMKARIDGLQPFEALLAQVREAAQQAQAHQDLPFEQLVQALHPERSMSHSPLFQVMFNHQVAGAGQGMALPCLDVQPVQRDERSAQFDLSLDTVETATGLVASLTYATDLFDRVSAERLLRHWQNLLYGVVANPVERVQALPLCDASELQQLVHGFNDTFVDYPSGTCVHSLIEAQAQKTPDAVALVFGERQLSYRELDQQANQLAHQLIELGVGPDVLVGICVERSIEMVLGLLAVLKAGGAYVPLDPEYPRERLAYMFEDSGIGLLLTQSHLRDQLPVPGSVRALNVDEQGHFACSVEATGVQPQPENLAYVIYTSGSTGKPKGAGNRHKALTNRLCWMQQAYGLDATDAVLQKTPFSFDVSVWEFFWPLMVGARLVVAAPGDHREPSRLVRLIEQQGITTLHFVPSMLQVFLQDEGVSRCTSLTRIVCSGEALQVDAQQQVFAKLPNAGLYNLYGPTEAAIDVTHWTCRDEGLDSVPIGQPIANL